MPIFILGPRAARGAHRRDRLRRNRRIGYVAMLAFAILLPTVDPVSLVLEVVPLLVLFEVSIWLSVVHGAALGALGRRGRGSVRVVSADWVVPVEGDPIADGAVAIGDDGRIAAVGAVRRSRRGRARSPACVIVPGFVNCHSHLEYAVYAGFGDGLPFSSVDRPPRRAGRACSTSTTCARSRPTARTSAFARASPPSATAASPAPRPRRPRRRACARSSTSRSSAATRRRSTRFDGAARPRRARALRPGRASASRRTRRTPAPSSSTRRARALGLPTRDAPRRERRRARRSSSTASGDWSAFADMLVPPPGTTGIRMLAERRPARPAASSAAHCVHVDDDEIALLAAARRRRRPLPALERVSSAAASPRSRAPARAGIPVGDRDRQPRLDALVRPVRGAAHGDRRRRARASGRPDALSAHRRARARDARWRAGARARRRGRLARPGQVGRPGRRLARRTPRSRPLKILLSAAVLGGSPDRVAATLVAGEDRYRRGDDAWPDSRRAARRARSRMLR